MVAGALADEGGAGQDQVIVAAAEVVAAGIGRPHPELPEEVVSWVEARRDRPWGKLLGLARSASIVFAAAPSWMTRERNPMTRRGHTRSMTCAADSGRGDASRADLALSVEARARFVHRNADDPTVGVPRSGEQTIGPASR